MLLLGALAESWTGLSETDRALVYKQVGDWIAALAASGRLRDRRELQSPSTATTVRVRNGEAIVTDGPFVESKEAIGGYVIVDVDDLDVALELASSWPIPDATVEVRPVRASATPHRSDD